ncbi:hypothetical protein NC652_010694 [Populus alba x Populus x berolinensis]|nr:hypothetical protein NC652_010694 [Populus alba x Populus x berolinensis]
MNLETKERKRECNLGFVVRQENVILVWFEAENMLR